MNGISEHFHAPAVVVMNTVRLLSTNWQDDGKRTFDLGTR